MHGADEGDSLLAMSARPQSRSQALQRPSLLILNQYYWPGVESTAKLLTELAEKLAADYDVTVVTGAVEGASGAEEALRNGVRVRRVRSTVYPRHNLALRGINYLTFFALAFRAGLGVARADVVLCMSDPPFISAVAVAAARRHRAPLLVVTQDVFPEIAVRLGRLDNRLLIGLLDRLVKLGLLRADCVVAIGGTMKRRLVDKGIDPRKITVIPNWTDTDAVVPVTVENAWVREHGLSGCFIAMHSGNIGFAQDLDSLVRAASFLRDLDDLRIVIIGSGARHADLVALAARLEVDSVRFLPYQPKGRLSESLSAGHVHVVGLASGLSGYVVPSRFYGVLAAGRPVIVAADPDAETVADVEASGCGWVVPPGRPELLAAQIRHAYEHRDGLAKMGRRGREYVVAEFDRSVALARYRHAIETTLALSQGARASGKAHPLSASSLR